MALDLPAGNGYDIRFRVAEVLPAITRRIRFGHQHQTRIVKPLQRGDVIASGLAEVARFEGIHGWLDSAGRVFHSVTVDQKHANMKSADCSPVTAPRMKTRAEAIIERKAQAVALILIAGTSAPKSPGHGSDAR